MRDFIVLKYILENHFVQKNNWRETAGIFGQVRKMQSI